MRLHLADALRALEEARAHQVLGVEQADELGVLDEVAPGEERELAQRLLGVAVAEVERRLGAADAGVGLLEHDEVERLLVAEVVVEHPLVGAGARARSNRRGRRRSPSRRTPGSRRRGSRRGCARGRGGPGAARRRSGLRSNRRLASCVLRSGGDRRTASPARSLLSTACYAASNALDKDDLFAVTSNQMVIRRQGGVRTPPAGGRKGRKSSMTVRIDRRSLLAGAAGLASLGRSASRGAWAQDARIRLIWWGISEPQRADREGDRALHRRQPGRRPSRARAPAGTTTGRGSRRRPPAATRPTSCRWTTATSSSTRAAACCCRSTTRWRPAPSTSRASPRRRSPAARSTARPTASASAPTRAR